MSFLRPNDLVWNYVVGNYLKGETPQPFDLLYWNSDGTNLPGPMYCWYLRNTYLENKLVKPGGVTICGEPIDLGSIATRSYLYASREDHIVPWQGAYCSTQVLKGKRRFVLGASGHIAGVINPLAKKKRSHWIGKTAALPASADDWIAEAVKHPGSLVERLVGSAGALRRQAGRRAEEARQRQVEGDPAGARPLRERQSLSRSTPILLNPMGAGGTTSGAQRVFVSAQTSSAQPTRLIAHSEALGKHAPIRGHPQATHPTEGNPPCPRETSTSRK